MDTTDPRLQEELRRRLDAIAADEGMDASRAALSARDLALYLAVSAAIALLGLAVMAL
ncbi:hypothetical protein ACT4S2_14980 [Kocuria turfanensis]|uniref:hypothetical protein n=1 Tax=Kocuria turfanensis TaxID=388357 RepID=UPI004035EF5A